MRLYVGNLSWTVTTEDLTEFLAQAGSIASCEVMQHGGRSKGWGLVEYVDDAAANAAVDQLTDMELQGRKIFLREDRETGGPGGAPAGLPPPGGEGGRGRGAKGGRGRGRKLSPAYLETPAVDVPSNTLFVGNLPWSTKDEDLRHVFAPYGVVSAEVKTGFDGRSRGYGVVCFVSTVDASAALALSGTEIDGREIIVRYDRAPAN